MFTFGNSFHRLSSYLGFKLKKYCSMTAELDVFLPSWTSSSQMFAIFLLQFQKSLSFEIEHCFTLCGLVKQDNMPVFEEKGRKSLPLVQNEKEHFNN